MNKKYPTTQVNKKQLREHRYVMEQHLGRKLLSSEIVHHKNDNKHDNRIENLEILNRSQHLNLHRKNYIHYQKYHISKKEIKKMKEEFKTLSLRELSELYNIGIGTIQRLIGKKQDVFCKCGNKADYRKRLLCMKCYLKEYYAKHKTTS